MLTGSGLTLLFSAAITRYGERVAYSTSELYGIGDVALVAVGVLFGLFLVASGRR